MKYVDEYRDGQLAGKLAGRIRELVTGKWTIMEICGGQTHAILKYNLQQLLPADIALIHGPGCPVCVTSPELIDAAVELAGRPGVILASFGDMLRVPGTGEDLLSVKARSGAVRVVYSPLDAVDLAAANPGKEVVFFAVGFETTAPAVALAAKQALSRNLSNFSLLVAHVLVPPAIDLLLSSGDHAIDGFLAPGHVCTVMGTGEYADLAGRYRLPIVITGFEPVDILLGIRHTVEMLEAGRWGMYNAYGRSVKEEGNPAARAHIREVFTASDRNWRGIGTIPESGLELTGPYRRFDAATKFSLDPASTVRKEECLAGMILTGRSRPTDCRLFGSACTPEHPLGAPMVSSEGACAAYYRYRRMEPSQV